MSDEKSLRAGRLASTMSGNHVRQSIMLEHGALIKDLTSIALRWKIFGLLVMPWAFASPASASQITVGDMSGPVLPADIRSFVEYAATLKPASSNEGNAWVQGSNRPMLVSGEDLKAMMRVHRLLARSRSADEPSLRTSIGRFCDALLAQRNDRTSAPIGQRRSREGSILPVWPNRLDVPVVTAGAEQGDIVGHLADCALVFGKPPATRLRARQYLAAAEQTEDFLLSQLLATRADQRFYFSGMAQSKPGQPVPWNQITMLNHGSSSLADAHRMVANWERRRDARDAHLSRATNYDRSVRANVQWFVAEAEGRGLPGRLEWGYQEASSASEDGDHAALDFDGLWNAYRQDRFGVRDETMARAAATFFDAMFAHSPMQVAGRVSGASDPFLLPGGGINKRTAPMPFVRSGYIMMGLWRPAAYPRLRQAFLASFADSRGLLREQKQGTPGARLVNDKPLALAAYAAMLDLRACLFGIADSRGVIARMACRR